MSLMNVNVSHCPHVSTILPLSLKRSMAMPRTGLPLSPVGCNPMNSFWKVPSAIQRITTLSSAAKISSIVNERSGNAAR
jgi:hypothetical protein